MGLIGVKPMLDISGLFEADAAGANRESQKLWTAPRRDGSPMCRARNWWPERPPTASSSPESRNRACG